MNSFWLAALLLAAAAENVEPPLRGRLCIGETKTSLREAKCSDTTAATIVVAPAGRERLFFWLSADARTAYAGVVGSKVESVVLDPEAFSALDTTIDGDVARGWPLDVSITLAVKPEQQWEWKIDGDEAKRLRRLYVPRGTYRLIAEAAHHRTLRRAPIRAGAEVTKLELRLAPLPVARGVIVDAEDKPIAEASITLPDETLCATANEQGAFTCELPERIPEVLVVSKSGYASRELEIVRETLAEGVDFGRVRLSSGRLLTLKIVRPEPSPARVSLFLDGPRYEHSKLKTVSIKEREEEVRFDAAEGKYLVLVEGDGPLERLEVPVKMKDADAEHEIRVAPFQLVGSVRFGADPVAEGQIEIVAPENTWRARLPISGGAFGATMWQSEVVHGWVSGPVLGGNDLIDSPKLGDDPSRWDIQIEKRMIVGRVFDALSKSPVTSNFIAVVSETENSRGHFSAPIKPDGSYQILANRVGTYTLRVNSPQHTPYSTEVRITPEDRIRTIDIALESGVLQPIDVMAQSGLALARTPVLEGVQPDRHNPQFMSSTDERGHYELRGRPGESRTLYFVPRQGSFAIAHVQMPRTSEAAKPLQVIVPAPSCALRVRSVDAEGKQVPAGLLIRYNGEFVPPAILRFVTGDTGTGPTGEALLPRLPAGAYEVWAIAGEEDEVKLISSAGALRPPVRVGLSSGEQAATVVAPPREARRRLGSGQ